MNTGTDNYKKHTSKNPLQRMLIERFFDVLLGEVGRLAPYSILDAGCGEGFTLERLRTSGIGKELTGLEFRPDAVEAGRVLHPQLSIEEGTIYKMPYPDASFDVVICTEVLEHLEFPEKALEEICRVASKYMVITVPNEPFFRLANFLRGKNLSRWGNDIEHIQHWSTRGIAALVEKYGSVKAVRAPFPWSVVVAHKRQ